MSECFLHKAIAKCWLKSTPDDCIVHLDCIVRETQTFSEYISAEFFRASQCFLFRIIDVSKTFFILGLISDEILRNWLNMRDTENGILLWVKYVLETKILPKQLN